MRYRGIGLAGFFVAVALISSGTAEGHGFGATASPVHYLADSSTHDWVSTEGNASEKAVMETRVDTRMTGQYDTLTDLSVIKRTSYTSSVDVYWFVDPAPATADALCVSYSNSTSSPKICNQVRVRFNTNWALTQSIDQRNQGACHEIGHSVGFDDSVPETNIGCMSGGGFGSLSQHEINHINSTY